MSVDEFFIRARQNGGYWELVQGGPVAKSLERLLDGQAKANSCLALKNAIGKAKVPCEAALDGVALRIDR